MRSSLPLAIAVSALLLCGGARLAFLEQAQGAELRQRAARQQTAILPIPAQRGDILDARGRVLAGTLRHASVFADPRGTPDPRYVAYCVAPVLGLNPAALERELRENDERAFVWIKRGVDDDELASFEEVAGLRRLRGVGVQHEPQRTYPYGPLASQVIGFVGAEANQPGLAGIEHAFDAQLRGTDGRRAATVDRLRRRLRAQPDEYVAARDGASVVLTIDAHLQQCTERHIEAAAKEFKADWVTAVVMDPQSGEVLAMATYPSFDPAHPVPPGLSARPAAALERLRNRAVADSFEPGSIFKPFIAGPALDAGVTRLDETFVINGPVRQFGGRTIHDVHPYGTLALREVISKSSNIGMGLLGLRCGNARLHEWVREFGFGDVTGIGLAGEHAGLVNDFSRWTSFSTNSIPIGQEIAVTPLQLLTAFCAFCNDGLLLRPRIVRGVMSADGEVLEDYSRPVALRRIMRPETVRAFRHQALAETVRTGTGVQAQLKDWQVFGKTGTAQVARPGGHGYVPGAYVGSFVGGAPARDPRVAVIVSVFKPAGRAYYGGTVAAPTAKLIIADVLQYLHVPSDPPGEVSAPVRPARPGRAPSAADGIGDTAE